RGGQQQRHRRGQPVHQHLAEQHQRQRLRRQQQHFQAAVFQVAAEQGVQRQQPGQQQRHPHHARGDQRQGGFLRPDREREQGGDEQREQHRVQGVAAPAPDQQQVAPDQRRERGE